MTTPIKLNGVHLKRVYFANRFFEKIGEVDRDYITEFHEPLNLDGLENLYTKLTNPNQEIEVVEGFSDFCQYCRSSPIYECCLVPNSGDKAKKEKSIISAEKFGLKIGSKIRLEDFLKKAERIFNN